MELYITLHRKAMDQLEPLIEQLMIRGTLVVRAR